MKNLILIFLSVLVVLIATLFPFKFYFPNNFSLQFIIASFDNSSSFEDLLNNLLLFMPLGCFTTAFLQSKKKMSIFSILLIVLLISAGLSSMVEILQIFVPPRTPTPADIINNTIGGIIGMMCFYILDTQSYLNIFYRVENSRVSHSIKQTKLLFIGYIFISFLLSLSWQSTTNLNSWSLNSSLLLGNEKTGDRPWSGYISEVHIADREFSQSEISRLFENKSYLDTVKDSLIAGYELTGKKSFQDSTRKLPELMSEGESSNIGNEKGVALSSDYWLKTITPVTLLNEKIRKSSQFTLITTVATSNTNQTGPARIISLSRSKLSRNFTLGQQENNLDLRIRTPITGENGAHLQLSIPEIFADTNPHNLVITFARSTIKVYVDKLQNYYSFNLLELIPKHQKIFYYGLTFIPQGVYLTFLALLTKRRLNFYRLLLFTGILLPSVILEIILVSYSSKNISLNNLLLGVIFTGGTMVILRLRAFALVKNSFKLM